MVVYLIVLFDICAVGCFTAQQADISFGHRQVEQLICDQPEMRTIIETEPMLRVFLESHFAGASNGCRVYWDCREPTSGRPAEHLMSYSAYPALLRISRKCGSSAIDKCAMLVFELNNLHLDKEFQLLGNAQLKNKKSKHEFAATCVRLEFEAISETQSFFRDHPLPGANFENSPYYSSLTAQSRSFSDYLRWLDQQDGEGYDPRKYYREAYDSMLK